MAGAVMSSGDDYMKLCYELEKQELEAPGGSASQQLYEQLLALSLLHNDLCNAKYLWKRIPTAIKTSSSELTHVWAVGQRMWQRDYAGVYTALNREWPDNLKQIMAAVAESTKNRALRLVAQAYSSISLEDFSNFIGLPPDEAANMAIQIGWTVDSASRMVIPKKTDVPLSSIKPNEEQLAKLTEFVCFLEN